MDSGSWSRVTLHTGQVRPRLKAAETSSCSPSEGSSSSFCAVGCSSVSNTPLERPRLTAHWAGPAGQGKLLFASARLLWSCIQSLSPVLGSYKLERFQWGLLLRWSGVCSLWQGGVRCAGPCLEKARRERSLLEFSTAWRRIISKMWSDASEVEGKTECKWQSSEIATEKFQLNIGKEISLWRWLSTGAHEDFQN